MQAGLLRDLIEVYKPELSSNEYGEQIQNYVRAYITKSQVQFRGGNKGESNNEVVSNYTVTFTIRRYNQIAENYLIKWYDRKYRILSIEDNRQLNYKRIIGELINE